MTEHQRPWLSSYPDDVAADINPHPYPNLEELFLDVCRSFPDRIAYSSLGTKLSFSKLERKVEALAAFFQQELNLKKDDRLAVIMPNVLQYPLVVFAAVRVGLRIINVNPLYTAHEMLSVFTDSQVKAVVALSTVGAALEQIIDQTDLEHVIITDVGDLLKLPFNHLYNFAARHVVKAVKPYRLPQAIRLTDALTKGAKLKFEKVEKDIDDIAFLQYTGGTTGTPKGAMLSHGNIMANVFQAYAMFGTVLKRGDETLVTALPLYHIFAMTVNLWFAFYIGASNLLILDARKFKSFTKTLKKHPEVTVITGVNTLFNAMLVKEVFKRADLKNLKLVVGGGAAVQSGVAKRFYENTGLHILEGYGLTECSPLTCVNPHTTRDFSGSIGIPVPSTYARIVDADGNEIWDLNVPGELEFKGPQVMKGYFNYPKEDRSYFHDGWLRTGDVAVWMEDGYIRIIDRIKDMILISGFNVFPSEIEDVVSHNSRVLECAVIGVPSETTGESVKIFVVKKDPSLTREELIDWCRKYLTGYKIPHLVEFVPHLPKSPVGKVMRRYLKQNRLDG